MTSSSATVQRDLEKLNSNFKELSKDLDSLQKEEQQLREESHQFQAPKGLKTTKIVKETISTDPEKEEIVTERETTTYVEPIEEETGIIGWFKGAATSLEEKLNPLRGEGGIFKKAVKTVVVSLLMMGTAYAVWNGLKSIGVISKDSAWGTKVESMAWGIYRRIPFLPYAVGSVRGFIAGLLNGRGDDATIVRDLNRNVNVNMRQARRGDL